MKKVNEYLAKSRFAAPKAIYKISPQKLLLDFYKWFIKNDKIIVEVRGGVAYCKDSRVDIIDYDNKEL